MNIGEFLGTLGLKQKPGENLYVDENGVYQVLLRYSLTRNGHMAQLTRPLVVGLGPRIVPAITEPFSELVDLLVRAHYAPALAYQRRRKLLALIDDDSQTQHDQPAAGPAQLGTG